MESVSESEKLNTYKQPIANSKFPISKILDFQLDLPNIVVKHVPLDVKFSEMPVFNLLINKFNEIYEKEYSFGQILYSKSRFRAFYDFVFYLLASWKLKIDENAINNFMIRLEELQNRYYQNVRSIEKYYDEIVEKVYYPKWITKKSKKLQHSMYRFEQAYSLVKMVFEDQKRDWWERYFEHLKWTMEIILRELDSPNLDRIIISLLHDLEEDLPEYKEVVRRLYGDYIADGVAVLSKKDWKLYLTEEEKEVLENCDDEACIEKIEDIAKERRNDDYFGHLDQLNDDYLAVKLADRIHNLRTLDVYWKEKILRKIEETEKYFLDVAKKRNPQAYNLIMIEIEKLKKQISEWEKNKSE